MVSARARSTVQGRAPIVAWRRPTACRSREGAFTAVSSASSRSSSFPTRSRPCASSAAFSIPPVAASPSTRLRPEMKGTPAAPYPLATRGHFYEDDELAGPRARGGIRRRGGAAGPTKAHSFSSRGRRIAALGDLRPRDRSPASGRPAAGRAEALRALHRRARAEGRARGCPSPQRRREARHDRRPRRGDHDRGGGGGDRPRIPGRVRRHRALRARLRRQRQADRARAEARLRALPRQPAHRRRGRRVARQLRPHRHGGLVDDRRHAAPLPRAARRRARQRRRRPAGDAAPHAVRHRRRSPS